MTPCFGLRRQPVLNSAYAQTGPMLVPPGAGILFVSSWDWRRWPLFVPQFASFTVLIWPLSKAS